MKILKLTPSEKFVYEASVRLLQERGMNAEGISFDGAGEIDWDATLDFLRRQKLFPTLYPAVEKYVPATHRQKYLALHEKYKRFIDTAIEELVKILPVIESGDPSACISKCFILSDLIYGNIYQRAFGDVDILTEPNRIESIGRLLIQQGYAPLRNPGLVEVPYHESFWKADYGKPLTKEISLQIELKKKHTSFLDKRNQYFRDSVRLVTYNGKQMRAPELFASFLLTIGSAYKNSDCMGKYAMNDFVRLRGYVDLAAFLLRHRKALDCRALIDLLEFLDYGFQTGIVMKDLCSLYPYFLKHELVSEILKRKWNAPPYSLYYPNVPWRTGIMHRAVKTDEGRREFLDLLKEKWFDSSRECFELSGKTPSRTWRMDLVNMPGTVQVQFGFSGQDQLALEIEIPEPILNQHRCKFVFHMAFEDLTLALPPRDCIELEPHKLSPLHTKAGVSKTFRTEVNADTLLNGRRGAIRLCASPVLSRYLENGTLKDITEDHYWAMPALLQLQNK